MTNTLVAYFSASGATAKLAEVLAEVAGADLYEIRPSVPYTPADLDWTDQKSRSTIEMNDPACRPEICGSVEQMAQYDTIFVGFPIWWYTAPAIIHTFLERYDFSGKTVIPFATSGGSGMGKTEDALRLSCSKEARWKPGKRFGNADRTALEAWVKSLNMG